MKMFRVEENEAIAPILDEYNKIVASLEYSDDKMFQTKALLETKHAYIEVVDKHIYDNDYSIASKLTTLDIDVHDADTQNTNLRDGAKKVYDSCKVATQDADDIESNFGIYEDQYEKLGDELRAGATQYDQKIDELIELLDRLSEKRSKKLEYLEKQEKQFLEEKLNLEKQNFDYAGQEELWVGDDEDESEPEALENELEELRSKLRILDDEYCSLSSEDQGCNNADEEHTQKHNESKFVELEKRSVEVNSEVTEIISNLHTQKHKESELSISALTLDEYEEKMNKELQEISKFWNDLTESPYQGFSNIEQEIALIKSDIIERNKKYEEVKSDDEKCIEQIQQRDTEIETTSSISAQLSSESREIETALGDLKSSAFMSEQYDIMTKDIEELCAEKEKLADISVKIKEEIENATTQMERTKDNGALELLALENANLMEIQKAKTDGDVAERANSNLKEKAQRAEDEAKELEAAKKPLKEKLMQTETEAKETAAAAEQMQAMLKTLKAKKEKVNAMLGNVAAPPPIFSVERDPHFAKPKVCDIIKKTVHKHSTPAAKRNWDSDSSWEGERKMQTDLLRRKYKKRPDTTQKKANTFLLLNEP